MKTCIYFAENQKNPEEGLSLVPGYGFTPDGMWRNRPLPGTGGLLLDDRYLPNRNGIVRACRALEAWNGMIVLDFERPFTEQLSELVKALSGRTLVVPQAYERYPHAAVLVGPWQGERHFAQWLSNRKNRYGRIVLDAAPLRVQYFPGGKGRPWNHALPDTGYLCPSLGCLHFRLPDGSILFWDSKQTLSTRMTNADVPRIQFRADLDALPDSSAVEQGSTATRS